MSIAVFSRKGMCTLDITFENEVYQLYALAHTLSNAASGHLSVCPSVLFPWLNHGALVHKQEAQLSSSS